MAKQLCELKKKGGGGEFKETVLWTNSSPTSNFNAQVITLTGGNISNYDYIQIKWRFSTTTSTEGNGVIVKKDDFVNMLYNAQSPRFAIGVYFTSSDKSYFRGVYYSSDTKIGFNNTYGLGDSSANNLNIIPLQIIGLKK